MFDAPFNALSIGSGCTGVHARLATLSRLQYKASPDNPISRVGSSRVGSPTLVSRPYHTYLQGRSSRVGSSRVGSPAPLSKPPTTKTSPGGFFAKSSASMGVSSPGEKVDLATRFSRWPDLPERCTQACSTRLLTLLLLVPASPVCGLYRPSYPGLGTRSLHFLSR